MIHAHNHMRILTEGCSKCGRTRRHIIDYPGIPCRVKPGRKAAEQRRRWARKNSAALQAPFKQTTEEWRRKPRGS